MAIPKPLSVEDLCCVCDPKSFSFATTDELEPTKEIIGQERALASIDFGLGVTNGNFNIYVLGESGTGKCTTVKSALEERAKDEPVPDDWCYVYNFDEPESPNAIHLPPGVGAGLKVDMSHLVEILKRDIPRVFESKDYEKHRDEILDGQQERTKAIFFRLEQQALEKGLMLKKTVSGVAVVPAKDGKAMNQDDFNALDKDKREEIEENLKQMQEKLSDTIREARKIEKETKDRIVELDREVAQYVVNPHINELLDSYRKFPVVVEYLGKVREDVLGNIDDFRVKEEPPMAALGGLKLQQQEPTFERYHVNLIVNNKDTKGAPVVFEHNPTYYNLFGRIEYKVQFGVGVTDFTMIKAGAVHRANGGYLIINAIDMLRNIFVYDSIKRMLKNKEVKIEDVWEQYRPVSTSAYRPTPVPVDIKVVVIGEPYIYYLLYNLDSEYRKLFKVKADFESTMERNESNMNKYAFFVATRCKQEKLLPFDPTGVASVVEQSCRISGDREKLTSRFHEIDNLIVEASYWAKKEGSDKVSDTHVEKAVREKKYRHSRIEDRLREYITDDTIMVSTEGEVAGQVNGMAVLDPGDHAFGKPSRITARTFMGDAGVVNIEREVKMSGRIHNKALMILTSFLGERFARDFPLTLSASVCFEQLYDEVEGDSATCTEVYALLSALSGVPIKQGFAVTGSMNQLGEVQPIGGVNEKIEGFFDVCKAKGLTGSQGVVIPRRNIRNLMLKKEVRDAVAEGKFSVYPIDYVDEGFEILTGVPVGERGPDGKYPEGTVNRIVEDRLRGLAKNYKAFGRPKPALRKPPSDNNNNNKKPGPDDGKKDG